MRTLLVSILLLLPTSGYAQSTEFCWHYGTTEDAEFVDLKDPNKYQPTSYPTLPNSLCPTTSYQYWNNLTGRYMCVDYMHHVSYVNQGGFGTCSAITGRIDNIVTWECFKYDVCEFTTHNENGMCQDVYAAALYSHTIGMDCNNTKGVWQAPLSVQHSFRQTDRPGVQDMVITGTVNTDRTQSVPLGKGRCGTWNLSGWISGSGHTTWKLTNPNYPNWDPTGRRCFQYITWNGTTAPDYMSGKALTPQALGQYDMARIGPPPGVTTARQSQPQNAPTSFNPFSESSTGDYLPVPGPVTIKPFQANYSSDATWIRYEWNAAQDAESYDIYRCPNATSGCWLVATTTTLTYTMTGLTPGVPVYMTLRARNATGLSGSPPIVTRTPWARPAGFTINHATGGAGQMTVFWNESLHTNNVYRVWVAAQGDPGWTLKATLPPSARNFTVTGVGTGQLYYLIQAANLNLDWINTPAVPLTAGATVAPIFGPNAGPLPGFMVNPLTTPLPPGVPDTRPH